MIMGALRALFHIARYLCGIGGKIKRQLTSH